MKSKKVNYKNYISLGLISISVIILVFYIKSWYKTYKQNELESSPLDGVVQKIDAKEIKMSIGEMNDVLIYFGYLKNDKIYYMEKRILSLLKKENLTDKFIYIDVTEYKDNNKYKDLINDTFNTEIDSTLPMILYVKNGKVVEKITPEYGLIQTYQIKDLIDKYEVYNN